VCWEPEVEKSGIALFIYGKPGQNYAWEYCGAGCDCFYSVKRRCWIRDMRKLFVGRRVDGRGSFCAEGEQCLVVVTFEKKVGTLVIVVNVGGWRAVRVELIPHLMG